jgi:hypothetical protein
MLYSEIIAVCSEMQTKHIKTLCGQNVEFGSVKPGGTYSDHCALKCQWITEKTLLILMIGPSSFLCELEVWSNKLAIYHNYYIIHVSYFFTFKVQPRFPLLWDPATAEYDAEWTPEKPWISWWKENSQPLSEFIDRAIMWPCWKG